MFENDAKGWHGSYSVAGRSSAEKFHIVLQQNKILEDKNKKIHTKDVFAPDEQHQPLENFEYNIDIFKVYSNDQNIDKQAFIPKSETVKNKTLTQVDRLQYHNKHMSEGVKKKIKIGPTCTKYNPKYDIIWSKTLKCPKWKNPKEGVKKDPKPDLRPFYLNQGTVSDKMYCFINMNQQTQRGNFAGNKDVRIRSDRPFNKQSNVLYTIKEQEKSPKLTTETSLSSNIKNKQISHSTEGSEHSKHEQSSLDKKTINVNMRSHYKHPVNAPDFEKMLSREKANKGREAKPKVIPLLHPNYNAIRERALTMTVYDVPKKSKSRKKEFYGIDPSITFDPDKILSKVNNHTNPIPPNFNLMSARNMSKGPLPSFMHQLFNREMGNIITDKSLDLNNYANGKFLSATTCFWPKKSFNKIVNLNLMTLEKYHKKQRNPPQLCDMQKASLNNSMKLCSKNFEDLIKEGFLNKFDNITYKSIKRKPKIEPNSMEHLLVNFENVD